MVTPSSQSHDPRLGMLLETMRSFAEAATDPQRLVWVIAERVTRFLGDGCAIFLASPSGETLEPVAIYNRDPAVMEYARLLWNRPLSADGPGPATAFRTGAPVLIDELTPEIRARAFQPASAAALDRASTEAAERAQPRAILSVPLRSRDRVLGALAMSRHRDHDPPFGPDDVALASTLADHAALALSNARLLESLQEQLRERQRAEVQAKNFAGLIQASSDLIAMAGFDGKVLFINDAGRRLVGLSPDADVTQIDVSVFHTSAGLSRRAIVQEKGRWEGEGQLRHLQTGELIPTQVSSFLARDPEGQPLALATVQRDLREQKRLEEHIRQVQKMEAVGRLAAGVAHDFNNLLFIILNYARALTGELPKQSVPHTYAREIHSAAERGAALTRRLLAFSRKQILEPRTADVGAIVSGIEDMLRTLLGKNYVLEIHNGEALRPVRVDVSQMEQVLVNLAANARDAMPQGGQLTIATANVDLLQSHSELLECPPGPYVRLSVKDTGTGIDPSIQSRIFDPFFTTKPVGKGTGLGLSIVFGVVKQTGGALSVSSTLGHGTNFEIYLPAVEAPSGDEADD